MTRTPIYRYLGTNGVIESPVHLEDIYYIPLVKLVADKDKILTNGRTKKLAVTVPLREEAEWKEINA